MAGEKWRAGNLEFRQEKTFLSFRPRRVALTPTLVAASVGTVLVVGVVWQVCRFEMKSGISAPWAAGATLALALFVSVAVLTDQHRPYIVEYPREGQQEAGSAKAPARIRRGQRHICDLSEVTGTRVVIKFGKYKGSRSEYLLALARSADRHPLPLLAMPSLASAQRGAAELAHCLGSLHETDYRAR